MKLQLDLQRATTLTPPSRPTLRRWLLRALAGFSILAPGRGRLAPYHAPWPWSLTLPLPGGCLAVQWDPLGGAAVSARGVDCRPGPEGTWEVAWRTEGPRPGPGGCSIDEIGFVNPG